MKKISYISNSFFIALVIVYSFLIYYTKAATIDDKCESKIKSLQLIVEGLQHEIIELNHQNEFYESQLSALEKIWEEKYIRLQNMQSNIKEIILDNSLGNNKKLGSTQNKIDQKSKPTNNFGDAENKLENSFFDSHQGKQTVNDKFAYKKTEDVKPNNNFNNESEVNKLKAKTTDEHSGFKNTISQTESDPNSSKQYKKKGKLLIPVEIEDQKDDSVHQNMFNINDEQSINYKKDVNNNIDEPQHIAPEKINDFKATTEKAKPQKKFKIFVPGEGEDSIDSSSKQEKHNTEFDDIPQIKYGSSKEHKFSQANDIKNNLKEENSYQSFQKNLKKVIETKLEDFAPIEYSKGMSLDFNSGEKLVCLSQDGNVIGIDMVGFQGKIILNKNLKFSKSSYHTISYNPLGSNFMISNYFKGEIIVFFIDNDQTTSALITTGNKNLIFGNWVSEHKILVGFEGGLIQIYDLMERYIYQTVQHVNIFSESITASACDQSIGALYFGFQDGKMVKVSNKDYSLVWSKKILKNGVISMIVKQKHLIAVVGSNPTELIIIDEDQNDIVLKKNDFSNKIISASISSNLNYIGIATQNVVMLLEMKSLKTVSKMSINELDGNILSGAEFDWQRNSIYLQSTAGYIYKIEIVQSKACEQH